MPPWLVTALVVTWGVALVLGIQPRGRGRWLYALALGPGVSLGLLSVSVFFWRAAGLPRPGPLTLAVAGGVVLAVVWTAARRGPAVWPGGWHGPAVDPRTLAGTQAGARTAQPPWPPAATLAATRAATLAAAAIAVVALGVGAEGVRAVTARYPVGKLDAVAMYNARARFLTLGYDRFPESLHRVATNTEPHRPLLVPAAVAGLAMAGGNEPSGVPIAVAYCAGLVLLVFALVRHAASLALALLAVALAISPSVLSQWGAAQVPEVQMAHALLAGAGGLATTLPWSRGPVLHPALAGLMLGMLVWTKNEGLVLALIVVAVFAAYLVLARDGARARALLPVLLGAAPGLVALIIFQGAWAPAGPLHPFPLGEWQERLMAPDRWWFSASSVMSMLFSWMWGQPTTWGLSWAVLQVSAVLALWYHTQASMRGLLQIAIPMTLICGAWIVTYTVTPHPQEWQISTSLSRVVMQVYPMVVVGTLLALDRSAFFVHRRALVDPTT